MQVNHKQRLVGEVIVSIYDKKSGRLLQQEKKHNQITEVIKFIEIYNLAYNNGPLRNLFRSQVGQSNLAANPTLPTAINLYAFENPIAIHPIYTDRSLITEEGYPFIGNLVFSNSGGEGTETATVMVPTNSSVYRADTPGFTLEYQKTQGIGTIQSLAIEGNTDWEIRTRAKNPLASWTQATLANCFFIGYNPNHGTTVLKVGNNTTGPALFAGLKTSFSASLSGQTANVYANATSALVGGGFIYNTGTGSTVGNIFKTVGGAPSGTTYNIQLSYNASITTAVASIASRTIAVATGAATAITSAPVMVWNTVTGLPEIVCAVAGDATTGWLVKAVVLDDPSKIATTTYTIKDLGTWSVLPGVTSNDYRAYTSGLFAVTDEHPGGVYFIPVLGVQGHNISSTLEDTVGIVIEPDGTVVGNTTMNSTLGLGTGAGRRLWGIGPEGVPVQYQPDLTNDLSFIRRGKVWMAASLDTPITKTVDNILKIQYTVFLL